MSTTYGLGKGRIEGLTDGIFATIMTVLVLSLSIPTITRATDQEITSYVLGLGPIVLGYVLSFLILAVFWVRHHNMFYFVSRVDSTFLWLNIVFLLTIGFVPFSTELLGKFWYSETSIIVYGSNLIATGLTMQVMWSYAAEKKLLVADGLDEKMLSRVNKLLLGGPLLYLTAIVVSLLVPNVGTEIAIGIFVVVLIFYVVASSTGRGPLNLLRKRVET